MHELNWFVARQVSRPIRKLDNENFDFAAGWSLPLDACNSISAKSATCHYAVLNVGDAKGYKQ